MAVYNSIGKQYSKTRVPDRRIVNQLIDLLDLPQGSAIADIGAGTGNYSYALANQGFWVKAIEPSVVMQQQAIAHPQLQWFTGHAENLPLGDRSVDGAISTLAIHHFTNLPKAFQEMHRVVKDGAIVLLTFDIRDASKIWLYDYFPFLWESGIQFLTLNEQIDLIHQNTKRQIESIPFLLPEDLSDLFTAAAWKRPEMYLNSDVRSGISAFALANQNLVEQGVNLLEKDLSNGSWENKYGEIKKLTELDIGYRFIRGVIDN